MISKRQKSKKIKTSNLLLLLIGLIFYSCGDKQVNKIDEKEISKKELHSVKKDGKVKVLNFGTFHMGFTNDANSTEFDENDKGNQKKVHNIAKKLAEFKPTVILVETPPSYNKTLQNEYVAYLDNPNMDFKNPSEIELLAYEIGRISGTKRIYGIDHKLGYNYMIGDEMKNEIDDELYKKFYTNPYKFYPEVIENEDKLNLLEKLKNINNDRTLDFLIAVNGDMLTHVGSKADFEGADEATRYYQRNLRMYSNMNKLGLKKEDRVFVLMGASHTAFFRDFISRSPKYEMVNTFDYLR